MRLGIAWGWLDGVQGTNLVMANVHGFLCHAYLVRK